jgi:peptidoglycan/LPS O-acetylase OafA/YrhL
MSSPVNSSARRRKERSRLAGLLALLATVIIVGLALTATNNVEDPFASMSDIVQMRQMLDETGLEAAAPKATDVAVIAARPEEASDAPAIAITWAALGEVFYDLWFMCAMTAAVIIVSYPVGWLVRRTSRKQRHPSGRGSRR